MKRRLIFAGMLLVGVLGIAAIFLIPRNHVEDWIGSQLQGIANSYLKPKLSFTHLVYQYPRGVTLTHLRLTADDPAHPGQSIDIIAAERATIELAEIPSYGKPIVIEKIALDQPLMSAAAVAPGSPNYIGFSDLLRGNASSAPAPASTMPAPAVATSSSNANSPPPARLSDVFRMRLVQINDGKVVYDPRIAGTTPMTLDKINTSMHIEPADGAWYKLDTGVARLPVFDLQLRGLINLDTFAGRDLNITLLADLSNDKLDYLPPELQAVLKEYQARGKLSLDITGAMPLMDPMKGMIAATLKLDQANFAMNGLCIPVEQLELISKFENGTISVPSMTAHALGGTIGVSGSAALNDRMDSSLHLKIANVMPENLLADLAAGSGDRPRIDMELDLAAPLLCLLGKSPSKPGEALVTLGVQNLRISADDPARNAAAIDLLACKKLQVAMSEPFAIGKPIVFDKILLNEPLLSAIAAAPGSSRLVGMPRAVRDSPVAKARAVAPAATTGPTPVVPAPGPAVVPAKFKDIIVVRELQIHDAKAVYDPRIAGSEPLVLDRLTSDIAYVTAGKDVYDFNISGWANNDLNLKVAGQIDLDTRVARLASAEALASFGGNFSKCLPAAVQQSIQQYATAGSASVALSGTIPFLSPPDMELSGRLMLTDVTATLANYRIPIRRVNLPMHYRPGQIEVTPAAGDDETIETLGGTAHLAGVVHFNSRLDSTLTVNINGMLLQSLMTGQIAGPKRDLAGEIRAQVRLVNAPLRTIIARSSISRSAGAAASQPTVAEDLPLHWGGARIDLTKARITGYSLVEGMTSLAKSAFNALFQQPDANLPPPVPSESVKAEITFDKDRLNISTIHYEGEEIGADGNGYITLGQDVDMNITGGPIIKGA